MFNDDWIIQERLGEGHTSKVFKVKNYKTNEYAALKVIKDEYLRRPDAMELLQTEIDVMWGLKSLSGTAKLIDYGTDGTVTKRNGGRAGGMTYILMEYVEGGLLYDLAGKIGPVGEEAGRFFMKQMLDAVEPMHELGAVHRDIKLENIMFDKDLNLKLVDFGFSTYNNIEYLSTI